MTIAQSVPDKPISNALRMLLAGVAALIAAAIALPNIAHAQQAASDSDAAAAVPARTIIRFVTEEDFPPFHYLDEENILTGFNIDVARAICLEVDLTCDILTRSWQDLIPTVGRGEADAVIASMSITPEALKDVDFSDRYYHTPARFVARIETERTEPTPEGLESRRIGVVRASAHEAYLVAFFRDSIIEVYDNNDALRAALMNKEIDLIFGDGITLMLWLNGTHAQSCCEFRGGAFSDPRFFGDGIGIAVRKGEVGLMRLINNAIASMRRNGRLDELHLRYFPLKIY